MFSHIHALVWSIRALRVCLFLNESALNLISANVSTNRPNSQLPSREGNAWNSALGRSLLCCVWAAACTTVRVKGHKAGSFRSALAPAGTALRLFGGKNGKKRKGKLWDSELRGLPEQNNPWVSTQAARPRPKATPVEFHILTPAWEIRGIIPRAYLPEGWARINTPIQRN